MIGLSPERVAVSGAGGPAGYYICEEFTKREARARAVARNQAHLAQVFAERDVETMSADALDPDGVNRAVAGCDLVVECIGLPAEYTADHPRTAKNIVEAARNSRARCLQVSSFWAYLPIIQLPLNEEHPRKGGVEYVLLRREAEETMRDAGAAVANLPDSYGPRAHTNTLQQALADSLAGKSMNAIGGRDTKREYAFVPDAARTIVTLAEWLAPTA